MLSVAFKLYDMEKKNPASRAHWVYSYVSEPKLPKCMLKAMKEEDNQTLHTLFKMFLYKKNIYNFKS